MTATAYVRRWREIYMKLQMVNVTRKFGDFRAVENLNLTIENGVYGLLGVNGAGKTTLMRMICTLLPPTSGQILCDGKDIFKMDFTELSLKSKEEITEMVKLRESKDHVDYYEMLGNVFMFHYRTEGKTDFAEKAKTFYELYLTTSGIFAMPIINRINELKAVLN